MLVSVGNFYCSTSVCDTLELDSRGNSVLRITQLRYWASGSTWMVDCGQPCSPNRFSPFIASSAALAIPIELWRGGGGNKTNTDVSSHSFTNSLTHSLT